MKLTKEQIKQLDDRELHRHLVWQYEWKGDGESVDHVNIVYSIYREDLFDHNQLFYWCIRHRIKLIIQTDYGDEGHGVISKSGIIFSNRSMYRAVSEALLYYKIGVVDSD